MVAEKTGGDEVVEKNDNTQWTAEYVRQFSELGTLQQAYEIRYQLEGKADCWRLFAEVQNGAERYQCGPLCLHGSEELARQLLSFFYENAVPPEHWRDVAEDILPDGTIQK